jgi:hypothetical protein
VELGRLVRVPVFHQKGAGSIPNKGKVFFHEKSSCTLPSESAGHMTYFPKSYKIPLANPRNGVPEYGKMLLLYFLMGYRIWFFVFF